MVQLVIALSESTAVPVGDLLRTFGHHLFGRFTVLYPKFFEHVDSTLDFLKLIDSYINVKVRKLYPDAELPRFDWEEPNSDKMLLTYRSGRSLSDVAKGLMRGCADHFGERFSIVKTDLSEGQGTVVEFRLTRLS